MGWSLQHPSRQWQDRALPRWIDEGLRGIAKVVTGGGKTYFACICITELIKRNPKSRIMIIVPTVALRDQWTLELIDSMKAKREEIYSHGMGQKLLDSHKIVIMVINSARKLSSQICSEGDWMLVIDECHRAASEENRKSMEGDWIATLGLSATPERQYDDWFEEFLVPNLGPIIVEYDYVQAKKDGVISNFELRNHLVPMTEEERVEFKRLARAISAERKRLDAAGLEESPRMMGLLLKRSRLSQSMTYRIPIAMRVCQEFIGKKMIVFHESVPSADIINALLDDMGFRSTIYHSKLTPQEKFNNLREFRNGIKDVLVTCRALDEGLNVKDAEIAVIVASTKSTRQRIQRLGRVLRVSDDKDRSTIITLYSEPEREGMIREARTFEDLIEISWFGGS